MTPLKIKITVRDKALEMQVLEQDERLRGADNIYTNGDMTIVSEGSPELCRNYLFVRGWRWDNDKDKRCLYFSLKSDRDAYLTRVKKLMSDFRVAWQAGEVEVGR